MINISGFIQEGRSSVGEIGTYKEKIKSCFNLFFATANWIEDILNAVFEFVLVK